MADIMISLHVASMKSTAMMLNEYFESNGISCWVCFEMDGGIDYREKIVAAVKKCKIFIPLINAEWARSGECKDEYNFAKRLNLTSHERGQTMEGEHRLPVVVPIAFPNLVWDQHPHVELLASSINFIVHERSSIDSAQDPTVNDLVKSINAFHFPGISIDTVDSAVSFQDQQQSKAVELINGLHSEMTELTRDMHRMMTCMQTLQTRLSGLEQEFPKAAMSPAVFSRQSSKSFIPDSPTAQKPAAGETITHTGPSTGWQLRHLRSRYLCTTRITLFGAKCIWTGEIVLDSDEKGFVRRSTLEANPPSSSSGSGDKGEELRTESTLGSSDSSVMSPGSDKEVLYKRSSTCIPVTGYMRWRLINAVPEDKDYDISAMAGLQTMITDNHEADEVFQGYFDTEFGSLETRTQYTRAVPGNPADLTKQVAKCVYSFVLIKDGSEMNGRSILDCQSEIPNSDFPNLPVHRCIAY